MFGIKVSTPNLEYTFNLYSSEEEAKSAAAKLNSFLVSIYEYRNVSESWDVFWSNIFHSIHSVDKVVKKEILAGLKEILGEYSFTSYPFPEKVERDCFVCV